MNCPIDGTALAISERTGIEIDYCPECRGVWLDRGELDKILERESSQAGGGAPGPDPRGSGSYGSHGSDGRRQRRGWLGELFD